MTEYLVNRLLWLVVVVLCVSTITFILTFVVPTNPISSIVGPRASRETIARVRHELALDRPVYEQYASYLWRLAHGNFGYSYVMRRPVRVVLFERFPATATIALFGIAFELAIGIPIGVVCPQARDCSRSLTHGHECDWCRSARLLGWPHVHLRLRVQTAALPAGRVEGVAHPINAVLPALTIGVTGGAWYARLLRSSMLDVLGEDYVRAARAKGLPERTVVWRHVLRNAWGPVLTLLGVDFAWTLGGVLIIEVVFGIQGIGWTAWTAILNNDVPMVMGAVLFSAILVSVANLVVDIAYTWVDPRVHYN